MPYQGHVLSFHQAGCWLGACVQKRIPKAFKLPRVLWACYNNSYATCQVLTALHF